MDRMVERLDVVEILKRIADRVNNPTNANSCFVEALVRKRLDHTQGRLLWELVLIDDEGIEERIIDDLEIEEGR